MFLSSKSLDNAAEAILRQESVKPFNRADFLRIRSELSVIFLKLPDEIDLKNINRYDLTFLEIAEKELITHYRRVYRNLVYASREKVLSKIPIQTLHDRVDYLKNLFKSAIDVIDLELEGLVKGFSDLDIDKEFEKFFNGESNESA